MTTTGHQAPPPPPTNPGNSNDGKGKRIALVAVLLVVIAGLAAAAGIVMVNRSDDAAQPASGAPTSEVAIMDSVRAQPVFEPANVSGSDAFFPVELQLTTFQQEVERDAEQQALALTEDAEEGQVVDPEQLPEFDVAALQAEVKTGIFGGTAENTCDPERLISFLYANPDLGEAWAHVQGIEFSEIATYIRSLEVRVLAEDVAVLNHGFDVTSGAAYEIDSVLAAGTAVLVDENGDIRTRCFCGNPIRPRPEPVPMPPRCLVVGGLVHVEPASVDRRNGLPSPLDVLLTGRETTIGGQRWLEIKWGNGDADRGWTLETNLRKHYCPPPTNYDYDCPGEGAVNTWADPERTVKAGEVTGTVIKADGPQAIFAPISPVGGPGGEVIFNDSLLIRFTQAFPSVQNSAWVHLDDLNNDDCVRIEVCISTTGPVYDRMNGAPVAPALTKEYVSFTGHFAKDPVSHAEVRLFDGAGTTGWITDDYTPYTDAECRDTPDKPVVDCAEGTWTVFESATSVDPATDVGVINNAEVLVFPNPAQNGRKLIQMGLPGSSVGPTGWVAQDAFQDGNNHCGTIPLCVSTSASAWSIHPDAGVEIAPFTTVDGVNLHGQWVYTGFGPVTADRLIEVGGNSGWLDDTQYIVHLFGDRCDQTPPDPECVTYQTPDPSNGQDPNPYDDLDTTYVAIISADPGAQGDPGGEGDPEDSSTPSGLCCIEGPLYFVAGGPGHLDTIGAFWVQLSGTTMDIAGETWFETIDGFWFSETQVVNPDRCQVECPTLDFIQIAAVFNPGQDIPELPDPVTPPDSGECCVTALYLDNNFGAPQIGVSLGVFVEVVGGPVFSDGAEWYLTSDGFWFPLSARTFDEDCTDTRCPVPEILVNIVFQTGEYPDPTAGCCIGGWAEVPGGDIITPITPERVELTGERLIADGEVWFETVDGRWVPESLFLFTTTCDDEPVGDPICPNGSLIPDTPLAIATGCCLQGPILLASAGLMRDVDSPTPVALTGDPTFEEFGVQFFPIVFEGDDYVAPEGSFVPAENCEQPVGCPEASVVADARAVVVAIDGCCISGSAAVPAGNVSGPATPNGRDIVQLTGTVDAETFGGPWYETDGGRWVPEDNFVSAADCEPQPEDETPPPPAPAPQPEPCRNSDQDSHCDTVDNCDFTTNEDQSDRDGNGVGDACDQCSDADQDTVCDNDDTCPQRSNIGDTDEDGIDDACDPCIDTDQDDACEPGDNCIGIRNPDQADTDNDGIGNVCDGSDDRCPTSQQAGNGDCCPAEQATTSDGCFPFCPDGSIDYGNGCCPTNQQAGNGECCPAEQAASSNGCFPYCPDGSIDFGAGCCPTSQQAGSGECCPVEQAATSNGCFPYCPDGSVDFGGCDPCALLGDADGDGICDSADACPNDASNVDSDGDGVCDQRDTCPKLPDYSVTYPNSYIDQNGNRVEDCTELI